MSQGSKYKNQRKPKNPPLIRMRAVRQRLGFSLEAVAQSLEARTGLSHSKGTISAVENGRRGISAEFAAHLEAVYGLEPGSITTDYTPRAERLPGGK